MSQGFRLGGINDPLNVPLCTPEDLATFGGRDTWEDETLWNYEVGSKSRVLNGNGAFNVSAFYMDISDLQATVTAGSCSSRVIFNVPNARSQGIELEFEAAPNRNFDFAVSASFNDPELRSTLTSTDAARQRQRRIRHRGRTPAADRAAVPVAAAATYQGEVKPGAFAYLTGTYQHVGSRFTQVGDEDLGTLNMMSFGANTIGGPLTQTTFTLRSRAAGLRPRQPAHRPAKEQLGRGALRQQRDRRAGAAVARPRARHARARRLPDEPAAHVRCVVSPDVREVVPGGRSQTRRL